MDKKTKIITCEKCFNIPKITLFSKNKILIECPKCQDPNIKDISYFDKYILDKGESPELPQCSFNENHKSKSIKFCLQCTKYLCEEYIKIHNISFKGKFHILINQKIENQYYCKKDGHPEFIYDRYCIECKEYLCYKCVCTHPKKSIYIFDDLEKKNKIKDRIDNVNKIKEIIQKEEEKLNQFFDELNKKKEMIKKLLMIIKKEI